MSSIITFHIIGGGISGLSAAVTAVLNGYRAVLYESSPQCGGRCRSFYDTGLERTLDNGSHLLLGANRSVLRYIDLIGGKVVPGDPDFEYQFIDIVQGRGWKLRPGKSRIPWWLLNHKRCPPCHGVRMVKDLFHLMLCARSQSVSECLGRPSPDFWDPLCLAILNTPANEASAFLFTTVLRRLFSVQSSLPPFAPVFIPQQGLSATLVDPALQWLKKRGVEFRLKSPLRFLEIEGKSVRVMRFRSEDIFPGPDDHLILAVGPHMAHRLIPSGIPRQKTQAIINIHYCLPPGEMNAITSPFPLFGIVGGTSHWVFRRNNVIAVTIGAAGKYLDIPSSVLATRIWDEVGIALSISLPLPHCRVVKETAATLSQTPETMMTRPGPNIGIHNLTLSGDWTVPDLPCTLEGAVESGQMAVLEGMRGFQTPVTPFFP